MKQADDNYIYKLLDLCRYIKWTNVDSEEELYNIKGGENVE